MWWFRVLDSVGGDETVAVFSATVDGVWAGELDWGVAMGTTLGLAHSGGLLVNYCRALSMI